MTAQEARDITISKRKNIDQVSETIRVMAEAGNDYACINLKEILEPEKMQPELEALGFQITISNGYFSIKW